MWLKKRLELENHGWRMVESESFLDSTQRMVESWLGLARGCVAVGGVYIGVGVMAESASAFLMRAKRRGRVE